MTSALQQHFASPDVTLEAHVRRCHAGLAEELRPRRIIYLDTKYWIILRDVVAGARLIRKQNCSTLCADSSRQARPSAR